MKYEPPEDSMMIDQSTVKSLELIQNLQNAKSKDCLFGILNQTLTPMGARLLKSNILQPLTNIQSIEERRDAVDELTTKEDVFFAIRQGGFSCSFYGIVQVTLISHSSESIRRCRSRFDRCWCS